MFIKVLSLITSAIFFSSCVNGVLNSSGSGSCQNSNFGSALSLNGVNQYVSVSQGAIGSSNFTIEAFVQTGTGSGTRGIFYWPAAEGTNMSIAWDATNNRLAVSWPLSLCTAAPTTAYSSIGSMVASTKYHIAVTVSSGTLAFYLNGVSASGGAIASGCTYQNPLVGYNNSTYFPGLIDEVRISTNVRYSIGFSTPIFPFNSCESNTALLLHLDSTSTTPDVGNASLVFNNAAGIVGSPFP